MAILVVLGGFCRRPWSVSRAVVAGLILGALGAVFHVFLFRAGPSELTYILYVAPALFWAAAGTAIWLLYRQVPRAQFRVGILAALNSLVGLTLFVLGVCGAVWCYWHHVCMGGHMAHPHYPAWHYLWDSGWAACLALSLAWLWWIRSVLAPGLAAFAAFLICFRFLLGSAGGTYGGFPL